MIEVDLYGLLILNDIETHLKCCEAWIWSLHTYKLMFWSPCFLYNGLCIIANINIYPLFSGPLCGT